MVKENSIVVSLLKDIKIKIITSCMALTVALISSILLLTQPSHAANTDVLVKTLEAEDSSIQYSREGIVNEKSSSANMWWASFGQVYVNLPQDVTRLSVKAAGQACLGKNPEMTIYIDSEQVYRNGVVPTSGYSSYDIPVNLSKGTHRLVFSFVNDMMPPDSSCDRNLFVDRFEFYNSSKEFSISGAKIIDPSGKEFIPLGVNLSGPYGNFDKKTLAFDTDIIRNDWKINTVRVNTCMVGGCDYNKVKTPPVISTANNDLDAIVKKYTDAGIVVMIDMHQTPFGYYPNGVNTYNNNKTMYKNNTSIADIKAWWKQQAEKYKNNPYVWFDLVNEPGNPSKAEQGLASLQTWRDVHKELIKTVRDTGANNIVLAEGTYWGQEASISDKTVDPSKSAILKYGKEVAGDYKNVAFSIHTYGAWGNTASTDAERDAKLTDYIKKVQALGYPLVIGETGSINNLDQNDAIAEIDKTLARKDLEASVRSMWENRKKSIPYEVNGTRTTYRVAPKNGVGVIAYTASHNKWGDYGLLRVDGVPAAKRTPWGDEFNLDKINSFTNPTNLTWHGKLLWSATHGSNSSQAPIPTTDTTTSGQPSQPAPQVPTEPESTSLSTRDFTATNTSALYPRGATATLLASNVTITKTVNLSANQKQLIVNAYGQPCEGSPQMVVKIDGQQVISKAVTETATAQHKVNVDITKGEHVVAITYANDRKTAQCDRNLIVDGVTFNKESNDPNSPTTPTIKTISATQLSYGGDHSTKIDNTKAPVSVNWNATAQVSTSLPWDVKSIIINAGASQCDGAPILTLSVDGQKISDISITKNIVQAYPVNASITKGSHSVVLTFANDLSKSGSCDRNIQLDSLTFNTKAGEAGTPPVATIPTGTVYFEPVYATASNNLAGPNSSNVNKVPSVWNGEQEAKASNLRSIVTGLPGSGNYKPSSALVATIDPKELTVNSDGPYRRSEVDRNVPKEDATEGAIRWIDFSVYIPADFQTSKDNGYIDIWQWKGRGTSSPPVAIGMHTGTDKPYWYIDSDNPSLGPDLKIGYVEKGKWSRITLGVKFSHDPKLGWVEARFNDKQDNENGAARYTRQTMQNADTGQKTAQKVVPGQKADTGMYAKMGLYTSKGWENTKQQAFFSPVRIASSSELAMYRTKW